MIEDKIDALIVAGWHVLETDFSEGSFQDWRKQALDCVAALCGDTHPYTVHFRSGVQKARKSSLLTGVGLLTAAQWGGFRWKASDGGTESDGGRSATTKGHKPCDQAS